MECCLWVKWSLYLLGRVMYPKEVNVFTPGVCEHVCLTGDGTCSLCVSGQCFNQLGYPAWVDSLLFAATVIADLGCCGVK